MRCYTLRMPDTSLDSPQSAGRWQAGPAFLRRLLDRYQPSEPVVLLLTALAVGVGAGLGAIAFRWLIDVVSSVSFTSLPEVLSGLGRTYLLIAPTAGGLLVGWLTFRFAREAKGHGVPEVMAAVALRGGRIRPRVTVVKALASSICIGSGGSVGAKARSCKSGPPSARASDSSSASGTIASGVSSPAGLPAASPRRSTPPSRAPCSRSR